MSLEDQLTNETLMTQFSNPFRLVNHAIQLAQQLIQDEGKIPRISDKIHNQAFQILRAVNEGEDLLEAVDLDEEELRERLAETLPPAQVSVIDEHE